MEGLRREKDGRCLVELGIADNEDARVEFLDAVRDNLGGFTVARCGHEVGFGDLLVLAVLSSFGEYDLDVVESFSAVLFTLEETVGESLDKFVACREHFRVVDDFGDVVDSLDIDVDISELEALLVFGDGESYCFGLSEVLGFNQFICLDLFGCPSFWVLSQPRGGDSEKFHDCFVLEIRCKYSNFYPNNLQNFKF